MRQFYNRNNLSFLIRMSLMYITVLFLCSDRAAILVRW